MPRAAESRHWRLTMALVACAAVAGSGRDAERMPPLAEPASHLMETTR